MEYLNLMSCVPMGVVYMHYENQYSSHFPLQFKYLGGRKRKRENFGQFSLFLFCTPSQRIMSFTRLVESWTTHAADFDLGVKLFYNLQVRKINKMTIKLNRKMTFGQKVRWQNMHSAKLEQTTLCCLQSMNG